MSKLILRLTSRICALFLALALALPGPVLGSDRASASALRDLSAQESAPKRTGLEEALQPAPTAGLEEKGSRPTRLRLLEEVTRQVAERFPASRYGLGKDLRNPESKIQPREGHWILPAQGHTFKIAHLALGLWSPHYDGYDCLLTSVELVEGLAARGIQALLVEGKNELWAGDNIAEIPERNVLLSVSPGVQRIQGVPGAKRSGVKNGVSPETPRFTAAEGRARLEKVSRQGYPIDGNVYPMAWRELGPGKALLVYGGIDLGLQPPYQKRISTLRFDLVLRLILKNRPASKLHVAIEVLPEHFSDLQERLAKAGPSADPLKAASEVPEVKVTLSGDETDEFKDALTAERDILYYLVTKLDPQWVAQNALHSTGLEEDRQAFKLSKGDLVEQALKQEKRPVTALTAEEKLRVRRIRRATLEATQGMKKDKDLPRVGGVFSPSPLHQTVRVLKHAGAKPGSRLLEMGCGDGEVALAVQGALGADVVASEHDPYWLSKSRKRKEALAGQGLVAGDRIQFTGQSFMELDWGSFDLFYFYSWGADVEGEEIARKALRELRVGAKFVLRGKRIDHLNVNKYDSFIPLVQSKDFTVERIPQFSVVILTRVAENDRPAAGLEEAPFLPPRRADSFGSLNHKSHLNRHRFQWQRIREEILPQLVERALSSGDREIHILVFGAGSGEELDRAFYETVRWLEQNGHPVAADPEDSTGWQVYVTGFERDPETAAKARDRLAGGQARLEWFPERDGFSPPAQAYASAVVNLINRYRSVFARNVRMEEKDFRDPEVKGRRAGLVLMNWTLYQLPPEERIPALEYLDSSWPDAWLAANEGQYLVGHARHHAVQPVDFMQGASPQARYYFGQPAQVPAPLISAGLEETARVERMAPEEFGRRFPQAQWPRGAGGVYLAFAEAASSVRFYAGHDTLWDSLQQWLDGERSKLPEGMEAYLLRLPKNAAELQAPGVIVKDWMLTLPYGQQVLPELEAAVGEPLPSLPAMILFALKGAGGEVEVVIGVMKLEDAEGRTVFAYFV